MRIGIIGAGPIGAASPSSVTAIAVGGSGFQRDPRALIAVAEPLK
jgi:hypothetical protein